MTAVEHPLNPEQLMEYLDGELPVERAAAVQQHVSGCDACKRLSGDLRGVSRDLSQWHVENAPASLEAPKLAADGQRGVRSLISRLRPVRVYQLSSVAAIGLIVILVASERLKERKTTPPRAFANQLDQETALGQTGRVQAAPSLAAPAPMIARTARLRTIIDDFDRARPAVDRIVKDIGGFIAQVSASTGPTASRRLTATLMVPSDRLADALTALKALGKVVEESQTGEDVTAQAVDLEARLSNSRNTEKRLVDLLQKRTGNLADVLAAEREIARVREEIERLDAERKQLGRRVTYATVMLEVSEERKAAIDFGPLSVPARFRNAVVDGFQGAFESGLEALLFAIRVAPFLMLWTLILAWPVRAIVRWTRTPARPLS
jgi:hypothetical protein